jgi:GrpB-like predicted nucleotidyltransferase (UPF0157 family)
MSEQPVTLPGLDDAVVQWAERRDREGSGVGLHELYELYANSIGCSLAELSLDDRAVIAEASMPIFWPGFERVSHGRPYEPVAIHDYDPEWRSIYLRVKHALEESLPGNGYSIHHIGSTSVVGLRAKPIVDVMLCVTDVANEELYVPSAEAAGFQLVTRDDVHRYFVVREPAPRYAQLHVCSINSSFATEHILFRDFLRAHDDVRDAYGSLKSEAAQQWRDDRVGYTYAKNAFITDTLSRALAWDQQGRSNS